MRVDGFWTDQTNVTNAQFRAFVAATGYVTAAEKTPTVEEIMRYPTLVPARRAGQAAVVNPRGPVASFDPRVRPPEHVHRGGSFLCCVGYCFDYRPSARLGCTPDTGLSHVGFRCARTEER